MGIRISHLVIIVMLTGFFCFHESEAKSELEGKNRGASLSTPVRWVLRLNRQVDDQMRGEIFAQYGFRELQYLLQIDTWIVEVQKEFVAQERAELERDLRFEWIEMEGKLRASEIAPNDPFYLPQQNNLRTIGLGDAWIFSTGSPHWPIAILDSGIDLDHPDLMDKVWINQGEIPNNSLDDDSNNFIDDWIGWNFVSDNAIPQDDYSHGSHVAGIAAAETFNLTGIAGIAWDTPIMVLKVLNSGGEGSSTDVAEAILYAADNGARVINLSLGASQEFQVIKNAVIYARSKDCLVIAAAGNSGGAVEYPAAQPEALAITATTNDDQTTSFSNRGPQVDLAAPGVNILSANSTGSYYFNTGTSMSTPHVSGVAALVWALHPDWSSIQISQVLTSTAKDVWAGGRDDLTGWGRLDASAAVRNDLHVQYFPLFFSSEE